MKEKEEDNIFNYFDEIQEIKIFKSNNYKSSLIKNLDISIKEENVEKIIIYFSKICYYLEGKNTFATIYKKNFDLIISKINQIKVIFEKENIQKISNLILVCIKNNIVAQIYLYSLISQIIFDNDKTKADEIINVINNLYASLITSDKDYYLVLFFATYYLLNNVKNILNYIDIKIASEFIIKKIIIMNKMLFKYFFLSKQIYIKKLKESNNNIDSQNLIELLEKDYKIQAEQELDILFNLMKENLDIINSLNNMNKEIFKEKIFDSLINCVIVEEDDNENVNFVVIKDRFYNRRILNYILNNIKSEYLMFVFDKLLILLKTFINEDQYLLFKFNELIPKLYLFYIESSEKQKIKEIYLSSFDNIIKLSTEYLCISNSNFDFYFNYIKNILLFTIQTTEDKEKEEKIKYINSVLDILLNFLQNNKKYSITDKDIISFELIFKIIKKTNESIFNFKALIDIISFFPMEKRKKQYDAILDELENSEKKINHKANVDYLVYLIKKILEIFKNINNENETLSNFEYKQDIINTIIKVNKFVLLIDNDNLYELVNFIIILANVFSDIKDSQKALMQNSFYQKLTNTFLLAINKYNIAKKNNDNKECESIFSVIIVLLTLLQDYINNVFKSLSDDNKRIILEFISHIDKIKDQELREKLAINAVQLGQLYINILLKEKSLEYEKNIEKNEKYYNMDEFGFDSNDEEENNDNEEMNENNSKAKKKTSIKIDEYENNLKKINDGRESTNNKKKVAKNISPFIYEIKNFIKTLTKTTIFNIKIDKNLLSVNKDNDDNNDESCSEEELENEKGNLILGDGAKEIEINKVKTKDEKEEEKNKVSGYAILIEDLPKLSRKRFDLIMIKIYLIEIYYKINDIKKLNSLFLEIKEECIFLNDNYDYTKIISLILDKILSFIHFHPNFLEENTICAIIQFIKDRNKLINNGLFKDNEKQKDLHNNIIRKTNDIITYMNQGILKENNNQIINEK